MKKLLNSLTNMANALSRSEMKLIMAGSGSVCHTGGQCVMRCRNCNNPICENNVDDCSYSTALQCCGPNPDGASCTGPADACGGTC